jgi:hypothetical protein
LVALGEVDRQDVGVLGSQVVGQLLEIRQAVMAGQRLRPRLAVDRPHLLQDVPETLAVALALARLFNDRFRDRALFDQARLEGLRRYCHRRLF